MGRRSPRRKTATSRPRREQRQAAEEGERRRRRKLPVAEERSERGYIWGVSWSWRLRWAGRE